MSLSLPDFNSFEERKVAQSTKIYDRTGKVLLWDVNRDLKRTVIPFSSISRNLKNATVAIEDDRFYQHHGVELRSIARAIFANLLAGHAAQGGSTITQQVVKNTLLTQDKNIARKVKEAVLALKLEQVMSKDQILEIYLNEAPYGGSIYGAEEASEAFFGKTAAEITLAEAAYLAALPQAPSYYSPYGNQKSELDTRKNTVLRRMNDLGFITDKEFTQAKDEKVIFVPRAEQTIKAPHFVMYVKSQLEKTYGEDMVSTGGLKVTTSLDWDMQRKAEDTVTRFGNENAKNYNASNAGLVAIDPKTGDILAMVGSRDYFNNGIDGSVNTALTFRQPGSSFKPFVYATAFKKGYTPDTVVFDLKTQFDTQCTSAGVPLNGGDTSKCYEPENYDGLFRGPITLRNALAQSINIPAIKTLYLAGIRDSIETARSMGIKGLSDSNRYGLTLVLGGGEVSLLDLTGAYSAFANDGIKNDPISIQKVEDKSGMVLEEATRSPRTVLDPKIAREITDILSDNVARTPSYGVDSPLKIAGRSVAVKTGTTNDYKDAWIVGYAPNLAVGVWAGNNDNTPMEKKVAGFIVAPLWHDFIVKALEKLPNEKFQPMDPIPQTTKPALRGLWQGGNEFFVDKLSKKLATENTPAELRESHVETNIHSILYWVDKNDPMGTAPARPEDDPQFNLWETPIQNWVRVEEAAGRLKKEVAPTTKDDIHLPQYIPNVSIISPTINQSVGQKDNLKVSLTVTGSFEIKEAQFYMNGSYIGSTYKAPWEYSMQLSTIDSLKPSSVLKVVVYDLARNRKEVEVPITVQY